MLRGAQEGAFTQEQWLSLCKMKPGDRKAGDATQSIDAMIALHQRTLSASTAGITQLRINTMVRFASVRPPPHNRWSAGRKAAMVGAGTKYLAMSICFISSVPGTLRRT